MPRQARARARAQARALTVAAALWASWPALAQRADQNAVTAAQDAFGTSTGTQSIGLYSLTDARGFSPQQAGNLRLDGLYYSQTSAYINQCMIRDTTMRIGIAAQSTSFPAPTGVADLRLSAPGAESGMSAVLNTGSYNESGAILEGQARLGDQLSASACVSYDRNFLIDEAYQSSNVNMATALTWRPSAATQVTPFWGVMDGNDRRVIPVVYTDGAVRPPTYWPRELAAQDFAVQKWRLSNGGILLRHTLDPTWSLAAGAFVSLENEPTTFVDEYLSVLADRTADHVLDIVPPLSATVVSGELRLTRRTVEGSHSRLLELSLRGRDAHRTYGGDALIDYGKVTLGAPSAVTLPAYATNPVSRDATSQIDGGFSYEERYGHVGSFAVGLLHSTYRRTITDSGSAPRADAATPWLPSLRFTVDAGAQLVFYGSYLQGLEDSLLAPSTAINRGEPPQATRTHQSDAGLRYAPTRDWSVIVGAFEIDKAYFNLDSTALYTRLGQIRHRGVESSATYSSGGITAVAGGVWLRPHVERVIPEPGATGTVPLGPEPLTLTLNLDVAPEAWKPLAAQLALNRRSGGAASADDRLTLDTVTTLAVGARYEGKVRAHPFSVRLDLLNATNAAGIHLSSVGQLLPEPGRRFSLVFAMDQ